MNSFPSEQSNYSWPEDGGEGSTALEDSLAPGRDKPAFQIVGPNRSIATKASRVVLTLINASA